MLKSVDATAEHTQKPSDKSPQPTQSVSDLFPHQKRVVERLLDPDLHGLLLWHGLGSGKTRSSIEALKALKPETATIVVPAALRANYRKELNRWWPDNKTTDVNIVSQTALANDDTEDIRKSPLNISKDMIIVDEAHRAKSSDSKLYKKLNEASRNAAKMVLLSGTPVINSTGDISALVNLAAGKHELPISDRVFGKMYTVRNKKDKRIKRLRNTNGLKDVLDKYVDYYGGVLEEAKDAGHPTEMSKAYPTVSTETVNVPLSEEQAGIYNAALGKLPFSLREKIRKQLPVDKQDLKKLLAFYSGLRTLSNTMEGYKDINLEDDDPTNDAVNSPKLDKAFEDLKTRLDQDPEYKAIVYSNFLDSGLKGYKERLNENHIPYGEFSGEIDHDLRDQLVNDYNRNKLRVLLLSSAGSEGLDLKNTRLVQILEPHWNKDKLDQVIGRAVRYKSHAALPEDKQNVEVKEYLSTLPETKDKSIDQYLVQTSDDKAKVADMFRKLVKEPKRGLLSRLWHYLSE